MTKIVTDNLVVDLIRKYVDIFEARSPTGRMKVYLNDTGVPLMPPGIKQLPVPDGVVGSFSKVRSEYLIGVCCLLPPPARLSTFCHEYGHAVYRIKTNDEACEDPGLTLSETAAMLSSLQIPDDEGLAEVAAVSVTAIKSIVNVRPEYRKAFENVTKEPLWLKYANPSLV